jgi:FkbM family methyltransferase
VSVKIHLHEALHRIGLDIVPYNGRYFPARRRAEILDTLRVDLVLDVGANAGQFGRELRREGYRGRITSFEPLGDAFERLARDAHDSWTAYRVALGTADGTAVLHRSRNSWSSSLLPITARHVEASADASYVGSEEVEVRTLDSFGFDGRLYLKIDAQGSEPAILEGASQTLERSVIALELSTATLYEKQTLIGDILNEMHRRDFAVLSLTPGFRHPRTREILQLDGIFAKQAFLSANRGSVESGAA